MMPWFRVLLAVLVLAPAVAAADWPQFRGPSGDGLSEAATAPLRWSPTQNVAWQREIPGSGWSSPVLAGGRLYLTTAVEESAGQVSLRALALDATDGRILWDVEAIRPEPSAARVIHTKNSRASATPIVADGRLYVHFGHMGTAALDLAGNVLWRQQTVTYNPMHGNGGSPVLVGDLLVFSCDAAEDPFVVALDKNDGEKRWRTPRDTAVSATFSFSTPLVVDVEGATQVVIPGSGLIAAYDPPTGREIWRVTHGGHSVVPRPVFAHGLLYAATGYYRPALLAIDPRGARGDVTDSHVRWSHDKGVSLTPSVIVVGDEIYFVSDNGVAACLDARTGTPHWSERLGGAFSASPVYAAGRLYFANEAGAVYVVEADKRFELLATNDLEERSLASPVVDEGALYLRTERRLWRIEE